VCTAASSKLKPRNTPHAHKTGTRERESPGRQTWSTHNSSYAASPRRRPPTRNSRPSPTCHCRATPLHAAPRRARHREVQASPQRPQSPTCRQRATTCRSGARPKSKAQCRRTRLKAVCGVTGPRRATGSDAAHGSAASAVHTHPTEAIGQGRDAGPRAGRPAHRVASTCHGTAWGAAWAQPGRVGVLRVRACARARACSLLLDLDVRAGTRERVAVPAHDHAEPRGGDAPIALQLIDVRRAFGVRGGVRVWGTCDPSPQARSTRPEAGRPSQSARPTARRAASPPR